MLKTSFDYYLSDYSQFVLVYENTNVHRLQQIGFNKKCQTPAVAFIVIVGVEFSRFMNRFTWPFLSYIDFSISRVNLHVKGMVSEAKLHAEYNECYCQKNS